MSRKGRGTRDQIANNTGSSKKQKSSRKTSTSALLTMPKPLTVWITTNCGKFFKRGEYQHLGRGCVGAFQSAEWALVKWLKGTDEVVDQALNDQKSRK